VTIIDDLNKRGRDPLIGKKMGHVEIDRVMAEGETGMVYFGHHTVSKEEVAVRVLRPEMTQRPGVADKILYPMRIAQQLRHPNIVRVVDCGEHDGRVFVAMEFVKGEPLKAMLAREGRLDAERATRLIRDIARGLEAAHELDLAHFDLRPANILMDKEGHPKINNFGLARPVSVASGRTQIGDFLGPPHYIAPEQVAGEPVGPAADQFALGVMYFEMIAGELPFQGVNDADIAKARLRGGIPSIAGLSLPVTNLMLRMAARSPKERYADIRELMGACERALYKRESEEPSAREPEEPRKKGATWSRSRNVVKADTPPPVGAVLGRRPQKFVRSEKSGLTVLPTMSWAPPPKLAKPYVAYALAIACVVAGAFLRSKPEAVRAGVLAGALLPFALMVVLIMKQRTRWKGALAIVLDLAALGALGAGAMMAPNVEAMATRWNAVALAAALVVATFVVSLPDFSGGTVRRLALAGGLALLGWAAHPTSAVTEWAQKVPVPALGAGAVTLFAGFGALFLMASPRASRGLRTVGFACAVVAAAGIAFIATAGKPQSLVVGARERAVAEGTVAVGAVLLASAGHALLRSLP